MSSTYLDDVFTLKYLLGLNKNIAKIYFFLPNCSSFEGNTMEMKLHLYFVLSLPSHLISSILRFGKRILI